MAFPRLTEPLPVTFALSASNPPGISRFFATWAAATHWPRFLNPSQAIAASWPVSALILPAIAVLWLNTSLGEPCDRSLWVVAAFPCEPLIPESLPGPRPAGGPPPAWERWAKVGTAKDKMIATMAMG